MFTGQLNWTGPSDAASQLVVRGNVANGDDSEAAFALVYTEALSLSDELCSEIGASGDWLDTNVDDEDGLPATGDSGGQRVAINGGLGTKRIQATATGTAEETGQSLNLRSHLLSHPLTGVDPPGDLAPPPDSDGFLNKSELAHWMDAHALSRSSHHCAMYCRLGLEAAGLSTGDRPQSGDAGDYGPFLLRHGAQVVSPDSYTPQVGDTVVFDKTDQHPCGHIEMYDGHQWVSDFMQHSFSPYRDARSTPPFTIYRLT